MCLCKTVGVTGRESCFALEKHLERFPDEKGAICIHYILLLLLCGTRPNHSLWYRTYWTTSSEVGVGFLWKCPKVTIQNNRNGCRMASNTSNQQVFTTKLTTVIHWGSCSTACLYILSTSIQSLFCVPQYCKSNSNPEGLGELFVLKRESIRVPCQAKPNESASLKSMFA